MQTKLNTALHGVGLEHQGKLTISQQNVFEAIKQAVNGTDTKQLYIDARGGSGKTFLLNIALYYIRTLDLDAIALAVAFTGIAAQLLQGGRTFNSRFKFPLKPNETQSCNISKGTGLAKLIKKARIIVWDEAPMSNKVLMEGLDRTLKDIMENHEPFGGNVIILAGDFRQLPTIIPNATRLQIVNASIKRSSLWKYFKVMKLTENMRIKRSGNNPMLIEFDKWLLQVGDGNIEPIEEDERYVKLPDHLCTEIEDNYDTMKDEAIYFVFGNIKLRSEKNDWHDYVSTRAILAPRNDAVNELNYACLDQLPGEEVIISSIDTTTNADDSAQYPTEYINSLETSGVPPHKLRLKKGCVVMLLRNLNIEGGLCNGTRLIVKDIVHGRLLKAIIANGQNKGKTVLICKVQMSPADEKVFEFEWKRLQFPVNLAFAITINKSQGQTLDSVAV